MVVLFPQWLCCLHNGSRSLLIRDVSTLAGILMLVAEDLHEGYERGFAVKLDITERLCMFECHWPQYMFSGHVVHDLVHFADLVYNWNNLMSEITGAFSTSGLLGGLKTS